LDNIEYLSFKAAAMIKQLLTFSRKDTVAIESLQLTPFIKETMKLLHASVPENIDLTENYCTDALLIKADTTQLHQVLMNLINNARDAVEDVEHPHISITLDVFQANQAFMQSHQAFTVEKYAHLSVMDNGCGIDKEHIDHLFEPFFTNKEPGKGTGLGLAMVFGAIANHNGHIDVESTHGEGATFHIYLPLEKVNKPVEAVQKNEDESKTLGKGELILLADDQTIVLQVANEVLNTLGYRTMTAENGKIALELYQAHAKDIDLCILDVVMPIMGGDKAAEAIRQINPQAKIIFSTGYDKELLKGMEKELILTKPYKFDIMNDMIQGILKG